MSVGIVGPSAIVDNADFGALFLGIPRMICFPPMILSGSVANQCETGPRLMPQTIRYIDDLLRVRWVKAPMRDELTQLVHTIAQRVARFLERDGENSYLASEEAGPMDQLLGHSITYRIAVG